MISKLLLPNKYKFIGWCLFIPAAIVGLILSFNNFEALPIYTKTFAIFHQEIFTESQFFTFIKTNITNTLVGVLFIVGALLISFSKEKNEDEFIEKLRLSSLLWAVGVNYVLLLISFLFVYGTGFLTVMLYNMFTVLIIFIFRFNYIMCKNNKSLVDEK